MWDRYTMDIPETLIEVLKSAQQVMVLTGAGVSAESGLPTFRDKQTGLWERFKPEELATPQAFQRDPPLIWGWYEWRRMQILRASPNPAHVAIRDLENLAPRLTLVTQNVDDLHERAGSRVVHHLHGTLAHPFCIDCKSAYVLPPGIPDEPENGRRVEPPRCGDCGGRIRPGVVWFGESLPQGEWAIAERAASECDVFLCIGTSAVVYPAASLIPRAADAGAVTVQINPNAADSDTQVSFQLRGPAGIVLPDLLQRIR
jgi:NAD-dependent deacetylase